MDTNKNRVYINPNFNRTPSKPICTTEPIYSNNHLYVNPNFTRKVTNEKQCINLNRKIYVNPKFIKTNILEKSDKSALEINCNIKSLEYSNSMNNGSTYPTQYKIEKPKLSENIPARLSSKSRYRLIRRNDFKVIENQRKVNESCTIKINKYKSIPFHNFKNNLQIIKNQTTKQVLSKSNTNIVVPQYVNRSCFKLIRHNSKSTINSSIKMTPKLTLLKMKRNIDLKFQLKLKVVNGIRKKNNIPCRLFTKYGKCLRNIYGSCEYLHDRKHVSLCRKFIKGICHDKECLLSHELSSKKMPTCFFYLKGMCTKDDCPYLHVKLNEKSKICHDFLKGYCDKGDMCLHRHVRQQKGKNNDKKIYTMNKHITNRDLKLNILRSIKPNQLKKLPSKNVKTKHEDICHNEVIDDSDCRYFKDLQNKEGMCEILMPTRCKLGTLPSFISLS